MLLAHVGLAAAAFLASLLTFFSGFGLGTLLLPVFALFFPVPAAVAATAIVHLANNLFKLALVGPRASRLVLVRFGIPALAGALAGGILLGALADLPPIARYTLAGRPLAVMPVKLVVALLMAGFAAVELWPRFARLEISERLLPVGGLLSGFFGGLSGHQGALRSAFLARLALTPESFVATGVVIACVVDVARLATYLPAIARSDLLASSGPLLATTISGACAGALLGARLLPKTTLRAVRLAVAILLIFLAIALALGLV